jgi:FdhD protein
MNPSIRLIQTQTVTPQGVESREDYLALEEPLEIRLAHGAGKNRKRFTVAVTMRTPGHDEDLALGFLFTEGIIGKAAAVTEIRIPEENVILLELAPDIYVDSERLVRHFYTASSCGVCGKASLEAVQTVNCYYPAPGYPQIRPELLYSLPEKLRAAQPAFAFTGGLHATGLFDAAGSLLFLREDIGRHNALDKVIGAALRAGAPLPFRDYIILVSGRAGFELVQKATMAGIPVLAAVGAPSSLSVELAEAGNMTLVGFLRGERFNLYAWPERIIF